MLRCDDVPRQAEPAGNGSDREALVAVCTALTRPASG